jgi:hypothetical protein
MKWLACFLILLLLSASVDDVWAVAPLSPSAPIADDDEYLPAQRRLQDEQASGKEPVFVGLKPQAADFPLVRRGVSSEWTLTTPFTAPPLYVFLSLQI